MIQNAATDTTIDAMNLRARRVFTETLMLVKETERLEAAGRGADADIVHGPLSMIAELISTHLGEDIPDADPDKSDLQHIRHMLWHVDDAGLAQIRAFLAARVTNDLPLESRPLPAPMSEPAIREALGLKPSTIDELELSTIDELELSTIDELELIWDNLDASARADLLGRARELYEDYKAPDDGKPKTSELAERRRAESNLTNPPDIDDEMHLGKLTVEGDDDREVPIVVDADIHKSGAIDVIVRIGTPRVGKA
jgi:hypothetical protein